MVEEQKNNTQENALNVGTEKHTEYYSYLNDSTTIIQESGENINTNQEKFTDFLFKGTQYKVIDGSLYVSLERKGNNITRKLANFVPFLKGEITLDNGIEIKKYLQLSAIHCSGKKLHTIRIPASEFNNMNWITKNWGLNCNIETGQTVKDYIRHAIQCTAKNAKQNNIYSHTGWTKINDKLIFLCKGLYLDEDIEQSVELDGKLSRYCLTDITKRNIDEDLKSIFKLLDKDFTPHEIILPLLAFAFLSPLNHFLKVADCEPKLVLFLIGKTGVKKSTISSLILSFFGDFTNTDLPISFKDTSNSIIEQTFILKDILTVIDDFHPSNKLDEQNLNKNAQTIMRAYGDRIGRNRLKSDSTLMVAKPPRGNAILTGESAPDISESGTARYIAVELKKGDINTDKLTELQEIARKDTFKAIMSFYIRWLYFTVDTFGEKRFSEQLRDKFINYRKLFGNQLKNENVLVHSRTTEGLSHLLLGLEYFFECIKNAKIITEEESDNILFEFINILVDLAKKQTESVKQDKPSIKFITKLNSLLESKQAIVCDRKNYIYAGGTGFIGYEDENYYYLIPDISHKMVKKLCEEQGESFPTTYKSLLSHLKDDGFIEWANDSNTKQLRLGENTRRYIWLKKSEFYSVVS